jgi:AraC-like DNA-binding protein
MFHFDKSFGLFVGKLTANEFHKHYALQISVSINHNMSMTVKDEVEMSGNAFYVSSKVEHRLLSSETQLTILIDPLSSLGYKLYSSFRDVKASVLSSNLKESFIEHLLNFQTNQIDFKAFCLKVSHDLEAYRSRQEIGNHPTDYRIMKALELMEANVVKVFSLEEIAEVSNLSPSRFLHLFKEVTRVNFRRYQLWNKIIKSLPYLKTHSISDTAHSFGFTDSSHYAKTFKETFGVNPKFMFQKR